MAGGQGPSMAVILLVGAVASALIALFVPELLAETSLGIDLGTTFSVAVVCRAGELSVLEVRSYSRFAQKQRCRNELGCTHCVRLASADAD